MFLKMVRTVRMVSKALDDYMSGRGPGDYDPLDESEEDRRAAQRDVAWARLLKAVATRWREDTQGAAQVEYQSEIDASKQSLLNLGVDVDALLEDA